MEKIFLPHDAAVMFVKCNIELDNTCNIPDIVTGISKNETDDTIKLVCVKNEECVSLPINYFYTYYNKSLKISLEDFFNQNNKYIFFTIDFPIEHMINLQYILVLDGFFKKNNINYYLILNTDETDSTYYKIYHYFNMRYSSVYNKVYIRDNKNRIRKLPNKNVRYSPGEILPYFNINIELYKSCFSTFTFNEELFETIKVIKDDNELNDLIKKYLIDPTDTDLYMQRYIYGCLEKTSKASLIIEFIKKHSSTPLLAMVLFSAIYNRYASLQNYNGIYESCINYAFTIEQIIENSFFYAKNGILSIRMHQINSVAMSKICKNKNFCKFLLEISLIDFQENLNNRSIITQFLKHADADETERENLKEDLNRNGLKSLFQSESTNPINSYFEKPNILIQHYGLQTIGLISKKTNSLLCVKSGKSFYCNNYNEDYYFTQKSNAYPYKSGIFYKLIIPVTEVENNPIYIGFNSNKYSFDKVEQKYDFLNDICSSIIIPQNREEKCEYINKVSSILIDTISNKKDESILVINTEKISSRLQLEYLIKGVLSAVYSSSYSNKCIKFALVGFKNKTFIKLALRFISLCYNRQKTNEQFLFNEIFLSTEDCKTQVLVSGKDFDDILNNLSAQRVFGTVDDETFEEMKLTLSLQ